MNIPISGPAMSSNLLNLLQGLYTQLLRYNTDKPNVL